MGEVRQITINRTKKDYPGFTVMTIPVYIGSSNNYTLHHLANGSKYIYRNITARNLDKPSSILNPIKSSQLVQDLKLKKLAYEKLI